MTETRTFHHPPHSVPEGRGASTWRGDLRVIAAVVVEVCRALPRSFIEMAGTANLSARTRYGAEVPDLRTPDPVPTRLRAVDEAPCRPLRSPRVLSPTK